MSIVLRVIFNTYTYVLTSSKDKKREYYNPLCKSHHFSERLEITMSFLIKIMGIKNKATHPDLIIINQGVPAILINKGFNSGLDTSGILLIIQFVTRASNVVKIKAISNILIASFFFNLSLISTTLIRRP